jgi:hypothetical protein
MAGNARNEGVFELNYPPLQHRFCEKLRVFIFAAEPKPFRRAVFAQDITGTLGGSKNQASNGVSRAGNRN